MEIYNILKTHTEKKFNNINLDIFEKYMKSMHTHNVFKEQKNYINIIHKYIEVDAIFNTVSPSLDNVDDNKRNDIFNIIKEINASWLELGVWNAFPDKRVKDIMNDLKLNHFIRLDFDETYNPEIIADACNIPIKDKSIDVVSHNSVLEHIAYPHKVLEETYRILKDGGLMLITTPFHFIEHGYPSDYLRYTPHFYEKVCKDLGFEIIHNNRAQCGCYFTIHNLIKSNINQALSNNNSRKIFQINNTLILFINALYEHIIKCESKEYYHSVTLIAKKPGILKKNNKINNNNIINKEDLIHFINKNNYIETANGFKFI